jgi:phosphatidylglycerophosphate synthase
MAFAEAYSELTRAQKAPAGVSLYSRYVNRKLGRIFAAAGAALGVTPDFITAISALMIVAAVALLALCPPALWVGVSVALLLILSFALDSADGQLARLQKSGSAAGEWLDHVVDAGKGVCVHGGVLIAAYRFFDVTPSWLLVPLAFQLVAVLMFAGGTLRELIARTRASTGTRPRPASMIKGTLLLPADSGVLGLLFFAFGWPAAFVILYTLLLVINVGIGAFFMIKWRRELQAVS